LSPPIPAIDHSNVGTEGEEWILLLPVDPDGSARRIRDAIQQQTGVAPAIVISDTHGRPHRMAMWVWRLASLGCLALLDLRGNPDLFGRILQATDIGLADEIAAAADLSAGRGRRTSRHAGS